MDNVVKVSIGWLNKTLVYLCGRNLFYFVSTPPLTKYSLYANDEEDQLHWGL